MFSSLRVRLTVVFVLLAVVPLIVTITIVALQSFGTLQDESIRLQQLAARSVLAEIDAELRQSENELRFLAEVRALAALPLDEQRLQLQSLFTQRREYNEITLLDAEGREIVRFSRLASIVDADLTTRADEPEYASVINTGNIYYSTVEFDDSVREPLLTIAVPVRDLRTNEISYVLTAALRFRQVWDLIALIDLTTEGEIYVTDSAGRVVAHRNPTVVLRSTNFNVPAQDGRATGLNGDEVILATQRLTLGTQELIVVAERPLSDALALATDTLTLSAIITVIALLVAVGFVVIVVRQVVRPVEALSQVAGQIQSGDLSRQAVVRGKDEISVLAQTFNDMTSQLRQSIETLESRVNERTRDLRVASEVSQQVTRVLDLKDLLPALVNLTRDGFGLSHVSVFLYDADEKILRLQASSGSVGTAMLSSGRQFSLDDKGLVPLAARTNQPQIINDVTLSGDFFANPFLPSTLSEAALPMRVGNQFIGVLDMQADSKEYFSAEYADILQSLAGQIAVAVRNAELFSEVQLARDEAEQANIVKSQFLSAMSHELRTPLNAVLNFTQFVSTGMLGPVNETQVDMLDKVVHSGKHLLGLINDVLDISKIEAGALKLFVEDDIDLAKELEPIGATAVSLLDDKPVKVITQVADNLPLVVGDRRRLRQIMLNLVSNACKFTEEGYIKITLQQADDHIHFAVEDTGSGIAPEDHQAVFETFRQTDTGLRQGEGTGLGLPISLRLAEIHGGRLWFDSSLGVGSTFHMMMPIQNPQLLPTITSEGKSHAV